MAVTSWPRSNASFKMADPTNPVAPINAIFIAHLLSASETPLSDARTPLADFSASC
jgi:hypothetical protein